MTIQITQLSVDFSTAPQICIEDMAEIAQQGYKTIINNRPDAEGGAEQPTSAQLEAAAIQQGLAYVYIPVIPNSILPAQIVSFNAAFSAASKPVLGFCRTGNRAGSMFKLSQTEASNAAAPKGLIAWLKGHCLITRLWRSLKQNTH